MRNMLYKGRDSALLWTEPKMTRHQDDWSWKPDPSEAPKKFEKKSQTFQEAKRKAKRFLRKNGKRSPTSWVAIAKQVSRFVGDKDYGSGNTNLAKLYLVGWAKLEVPTGTYAQSIRGQAEHKKSKAKGFYRSWEWKKARFETLKRYGAICMLCGSDKYIVVDHIKPRSKYPELELDLDNLQVLCNDCNMGKSNDDETDFRPIDDELSHAEFAELTLVHDAERLQ